MLAQKHLEASEIAVVGRGVESVVRRLVRFLVGKISLVKLQRLIEFLYIEELENKLRAEQPERSIKLAQLALNTGLDTRVISRIKADPSYRKGLVNELEFFRDFTPAARLLHAWSTDERFIDAATGRPNTLSISGATGSLEQLARSISLPRGLTIKAVLDQLESSALVTVDKDRNEVRMRVDRYLPTPSKDRAGAIEIGFLAVSRLLDTVVSNIESSDQGHGRLLQRVYWINRLSPARQKDLVTQLTQLLGNAEKHALAKLGEFDDLHTLPGQMSAGFGLYLFEDQINTQPEGTATTVR